MKLSPKELQSFKILLEYYKGNIQRISYATKINRRTLMNLVDKYFPGEYRPLKKFGDL